MRVYYDKSPRGVVVLGADPYSEGACSLVAALNNVPEPGACACYRGEQCDTPHENWEVLENRNGHFPFPAFWVSGDCPAAYHGWKAPVPFLEVPDEASEEEIFLFVLRTCVAYEETISVYREEEVTL